MSTRERILDAALQCFAEQGYSRTSLRQLAAHVGIRAPSLYNHFANKREIMQALLERSGPGRMAQIIEQLPADLPPAALLETVLEGLFALWRDPEDNRSMRLVCAEALHDPELGALLETQVFQHEREQLTRLMLRSSALGQPERAEQWASLCITLGFARRMQLLLAGEDADKTAAIIAESRAQFRQLAQWHGLTFEPDIAAH